MVCAITNTYGKHCWRHVPCCTITQRQVADKYSLFVEGNTSWQLGGGFKQGICEAWILLIPAWLLFALPKQKVEFPAYASPSHCSHHPRLWKVNFAKTWLGFGELFNTLYWRASALFENCLLFLFHALYLIPLHHLISNYSFFSRCSTC